MPPRAVRNLAQLDFAGPDAAAFLQGYLTADLDALRAPDVDGQVAYPTTVGERVSVLDRTRRVRLDRLEPQRALPMALCNLKGRVVANGWVAGEASHVRLLVHPSVTGHLTRELGKYLPFAKAKLEETATGLGLFPDASPGATELAAVGYYATVRDTDENHAEFAGACADAGFVLVTEAIAERFLPQMIGLTDIGAVNFAKGCYLGQEVVARAEHRGRVKQQMRRYRFDAAPPPVGSDVVDGSRKLGTVVAVGEGIALAAVRSDASPVVAGDCRMAIST